jgi:carbohydrate kinase (thermoresistant glucokinase family)
VAAEPRPVVVVVMGVSGSGKTTVAALLARTLHWDFVEGDDLHPAANVAKMHAGTPLSDADRAPWLARIAAAIDRLLAAGQGGVVACSALRRAYRDVLIGDRSDVALVYLRGDHDVLAARMRARPGHFMPVSLLDSQLATLEEPGVDEHPIVLPITGTPAATVRAIISALEGR